MSGLTGEPYNSLQVRPGGNHALTRDGDSLASVFCRDFFDVGR